MSREVKLSRQEAVSIIGLKGNASDEEVRKKHRILAKKYHPDLVAARGGDVKEANEKMALINTAVAVLLEKKQILKVKKNIKPYLDELKRKVPPGSMVSQLDDVFAVMVKQERFRKDISAEEALGDARKIYEKQLKAEGALLARGRNAVRKRILRRARFLSLSDDEKIAELLQIKRREKAEFEAMNRILARLNSVINGAFKISKKPFVYIVVKYKNNRFLRATALTASMMVAILGGKYIYDRRLRAFIKKNRALVKV
jgi:curved DNA-binding protein CbpA